MGSIGGSLFLGAFSISVRAGRGYGCVGVHAGGGVKMIRIHSPVVVWYGYRCGWEVGGGRLPIGVEFLAFSEIRCGDILGRFSQER